MNGSPRAIKNIVAVIIVPAMPRAANKVSAPRINRMPPMNWVSIVANLGHTGMPNSAANSDGRSNLPLPCWMNAMPTKQRRIISANASLVLLTVGKIHVDNLRIILPKRGVSVKP